MKQLGVETIGLGAPVFARYGYARCVDDVGLEQVAGRLSSQRASQKPSTASLEGDYNALDLASPAFSASSRQRCSSFSNVLSSTASFFNGWRSTPGTMPATSQLDRLYLDGRHAACRPVQGW